MAESATRKPAAVNLFKATGTIGGLTLVSRVAGFAREMLMARVMGASWQADAFFVAFRNLPEEALPPFLLVEAPRLLFPFARQIIADAVQNTGFPPLLLDPIDFAGAYMAQVEAANAGSEPNGHAAPELASPEPSSPGPAQV